MSAHLAESFVFTLLRSRCEKQNFHVSYSTYLTLILLYPPIFLKVLYLYFSALAVKYKTFTWATLHFLFNYIEKMVWTKFLYGKLHIKVSTYCCFLPDLTRFIGFYWCPPYKNLNSYHLHYITNWVFWQEVFDLIFNIIIVRIINIYFIIPFGIAISLCSHI